MDEPDLRQLDLAACADEPIHIPGSIQPHGWLFGFAADGVITHASANADTLTGQTAPACIGRTLAEVLPDTAAHVLTGLRGWAARPYGGFVGEMEAGGACLRCFAHRAEQALILELEREHSAPRGHGEALQADVLEFGRAAEDVEDWQALAALAARTARRASGFDRVLIYRFDSNANGSVVAEDGNGVLPSYLGLHFPESDIPAQARAMYRRSRLRLIPDADQRPVPVWPDCGPMSAAPLDLRQAALRSVSPYHLHYMRNMGTGASMSASLIVDGELWGLISFHSAAPHHAPFAVRSAMEFLAQILASGIASRAHLFKAEAMQIAQLHHDRLLAAMAASTPPRPDVLVDEAPDLLALTGAAGAALLTETACLYVGDTPPEPALRDVAAWLHRRGEREVFATDRLSELWPQGAPFRDCASGLLAVSVSELYPSYLMWFRPEVVRTIDWAGDPDGKGGGAAPGDGTGAPAQGGLIAALSPRRSFALWRENVEGMAAPWGAHATEAAERLRSAIVGVVLRRAEELAGLSRELTRTNKELEAFSYSISHDLRAPFRHIVGYAELLREAMEGKFDERGARYLRTIIDSAISAGQLVDDLLHFSRLGRMAMSLSWISMTKLVEEAQRGLELDAAGRRVTWRVGALPPGWGDPSLLRQAVVNLLSNALKYSRGRDPAVIEISGEQLPDGTRYSVRDNGVGFDMTYAGKLFGVFQRLHLAEQYEGTGIGLALTRRIIERHGGTIEGRGIPNQGACFTFTLPSPRRDNPRRAREAAAPDAPL